MKLSQDRSDVFGSLSSNNDMHSRVLNSLKLVKVNRRRATEDGVTVVQSPVDHAAGNGICSVLVNVFPDVT